MKKQKRQSPKSVEKSRGVLNGMAHGIAAGAGGFLGVLAAIGTIAISTDAQQIWSQLRMRFPEKSQQLMLDVFEKWTEFEVRHHRMSTEAGVRFVRFIRMKREEISFIEPRVRPLNEFDHFFASIVFGNIPSWASDEAKEVRDYLVALGPNLYV